jgi:hypothetical protein
VRAAAGLEEADHGDGVPDADGADVVGTGEAGEEGDDADPAAHGGSIRAASREPLPAGGRAPDRGQEMRPRKSHRRGNDALPRGLEPENEGTRGSLGRNLRNSWLIPDGEFEAGRTPGF